MSIKLNRPAKRSRSVAILASDRANEARRSKATVYLNKYTIINSFEKFGPNIKVLFNGSEFSSDHLIKFFKDEASMRKDLELYDLGAKEYESAR